MQFGRPGSIHQVEGDTYNMRRTYLLFKYIDDLAQMFGKHISLCNIGDGIDDLVLVSKLDVDTAQQMLVFYYATKIGDIPFVVSEIVLKFPQHPC